MEDRKANNDRSSLIFAIILGHFLIDFFITIISPVLYLFADKLSLTLFQQGLLSALIIISGSVLQPVVGYFSDGRSKGATLLISVLWIGIFYSLSGIINNYYILLIVVVLGGFASAVYHPIGTAFMIEVSGGSKGKSVSNFLAIGSLAMPTASAIAIILTNRFGLRGLTYLLIPCIIGVILMYMSGLNKLSIGKNLEDGKKVELKLNKYVVKWIILLITIPTMKNLVFRSLITFGIQYLTIKSLGTKIAGIAVTMFLFAEPAGTYLGGILSEKYGNKNVLILSGIGGIIMFTIAYLGTGQTILIFLILMTLFINLVNTPIILLTQNLIPKNTNFATGLVFGLPMGLGGFGTMVVGKVADLTGLVTAVKYLSIALIFMIMIALFIPKEWKNQEYLSNT